MRKYLMSFLSALELAVPPTCSYVHHTIKCAEYGSDARGWEIKLALDVFVSNTELRTLYFDDTDFEKPVEALVAECLEVLKLPAEKIYMKG